MATSAQCVVLLPNVSLIVAFRIRGVCRDSQVVYPAFAVVFSGWFFFISHFFTCLHLRSRPTPGMSTFFFLQFFSCNFS
jgi:hypothetical protein